MKYRLSIISIAVLAGIFIGIIAVRVATRDTPDQQAKLFYYDTEQARLAAEIKESHKSFFNHFETIAGADAASKFRSGVLGELVQRHDAGGVSDEVYVEANAILDKDARLQLETNGKSASEMRVDEILSKATSTVAQKRRDMKNEPLKHEAARLTQEIAELVLKNKMLQADRSQHPADVYAVTQHPAEILALKRWIQGGWKAPPPPPPSTGPSYSLYDVGLEKWPETQAETLRWFLDRIALASDKPEYGKSINDHRLERYSRNIDAEMTRKRARLSAVEILLKR